MTTLAIIGAGIAGRSLIYALAKQQKAYSKIVVFDSDTFARTCSFRSTAIAAPRGVSTGHSDLGDLIVRGFETLKNHVEMDRPQGIFPITQFTAAMSKLDQFKKRYPTGAVVDSFLNFQLKHEIYLAKEDAYLFDPELYLNWLLDQARPLEFEMINSFVTQLNPTESGVEVKTHHGQVFQFDKVIFTGGSFNRFWGNQKVGRPVHGSYFEFKNVQLGDVPFSLTLEGDNLVYHAHSQKLLVGSTSKDVTHCQAFEKELRAIYQRLKERVKVDLPPIEYGQIITGMREKASKRAPYVLREGNIIWFGGLYKNGYSLSLHLAKKLATIL